MSEPVSTDDAPQAIGPYSQAINAGNYLFCSGQVGLDPSSGELVEGGIKVQTERALQNLKAVVEAGGASLEDVVKTTVFLDSMDDFNAMNDVYAEFFTQPYPARSTVAVKQLPRGALVEVEAVVRAG
jgi:2-iminobutanoate/2-iminopropanoate deaminase